MSNFYIKFLKRNNETQVGWRPDSREDLLYEETIREEERDRRIVSVLRKYLDLEFEARLLSEFNRKDFEALGELLFDLIFTNNNLIIEFEAWYSSALNDEKGTEAYNFFLEFDLEKEFDDLAILPWEYIHYRPKAKGMILDEPFLAASSNKKIIFYRKIPFKFIESREKELFELEPPLKILLIIADPTTKPLTKKAELLSYFRQLKENYPEDQKLQIKYLYQPNPEQDKFQLELNNGQTGLSELYSLDNELGEKIGRHDSTFEPDIIHFVGHGYVKDKNGILILTKEDKSIGGKFYESELTDIRFANCLKNSRLKPKLVFLQVCNGGRIVDYMNKAGIATRLLEKKIPFVIAMQNPVQEDHALRFTQTFYNKFLTGANIGTCASAGRYELGGQGEYNQKAFGSPVLFTYVDFPLKLKQISTQTIENDQKQESTIKFCNNPGCPYYRNETRYKHLDNICSSCGHKLTGKSILLNSDELNLPGSIMADLASPSSMRLSHSRDLVSKPGSSDKLSTPASQSNGNSDSIRYPQQNHRNG